MKKLRSFRLPGGFTLVELLVVIAIIAILAGLLLSTAGYVQRKGATSRAESEIASISAALESYKADYGDYLECKAAPGASVVTGATILFNSLVRGTNSQNTNNPLGKLYMDPPKSMLNITNAGYLNNSANYFKDPFGSPYQYQYFPGNVGGSNRSGPYFFDLWSYGGKTAGNQITNTNFWIKNW